VVGEDWLDILAGDVRSVVALPSQVGLRPFGEIRGWATLEGGNRFGLEEAPES
jgi:hypothetical protein